MRNVLTHFEEYVLDEGHLQRQGSVEPGSTSWRVNMADGDVTIVYGPFAVPLLAVAGAAADVMTVADEVWLQAIRDTATGSTPTTARRKRRRLERPRRTPASAASEPSRLAVERRRGVGP